MPQKTAKKSTIKDIADKAGVSIGSVHCALSGKAGVGERTRERILRIAKECDYRPNLNAASLKRKALRLAAVFPEPVRENRFYFAGVWEGVRDYLSTMRDYNIQLAELPYDGSDPGQGDALADIVARGGVDGVLTPGLAHREGLTLLKRLKRSGVPVVVVSSDVPPGDRLCCVQPDYDIVGRTVAELLSWMAPSGPVVIAAGTADLPAHYEMAEGLEAFFRGQDAPREVVRIHNHAGANAYRADIARHLERRAACCCAVSAQSSHILGLALDSSPRRETIPAVGCDVFAENLAFLESGVFAALLHKNPYSQAYMAAKCLAEYLLNGVAPDRGTILVGSELVFRSGIPLFQSGRQTLHVAIG